MCGAYNYSAMRFYMHIKPIKIIARYFKNVKVDVFYCGFPANHLDNIQKIAKEKGYLINQINEKQIAIKNIPNDEAPHINFMCGEVGYDEWKLKHSKKTNTGNTLNEPSEEYHNMQAGLTEVLTKISEFPLENSTPIQTMLFVQELKHQILNTKSKWL